jgi:hypothetical protein
MAVTYIYRNNKTLGPYEDASIYEMLRTGQCSLDDLACHEGMKDWRPLRSILPPNDPNRAFLPNQVGGQRTSKALGAVAGSSLGFAARSCSIS